MVDHVKKKALIIGVSDYDSDKLHQLPFCRNDGEAMNEILGTLGFDIPKECFLVGKVGGEAMKKTVIKFLRKDADVDDLLLLYFSGHGVPDGHGRTFLSSSDMDPDVPEENGLGFRDLQDIIERSDAQRIVTILDCCFSGAMGIGGDDGIMSDEEAIAKQGRAAIENTFEEGDGKCVLASSLGAQQSFKKDDADFSVFTFFLLDGLKGGNGESVDIKGNVTPYSLGRYLYRKMMAYEKVNRQKPITKASISGDFSLGFYEQFAKGAADESEKEKLLKYLRSGNVQELNSYVSQKVKGSDEVLDLSGIDLSNPKSRAIEPSKLTDADRPKLNGVTLARADISRSILTAANFVKAQLAGANLERAKANAVNFQGANLNEANLRLIDLRDGANLEEANLQGSDLSESILEGASLKNADLKNANLKNARLERAILSGAEITKSDLSDSVLSGCDLSKAILSDSNLSRARIQGSNLTGANLIRVDASYAKFNDSNLADCDMSEANFKNADLTGANLSDAFMVACSFADADLSDAILSDSNLSNTNFGQADLSGAVISGADLSDADFSDANLSESILSRAILSNTTLAGANLSGANLYNAVIIGSKSFSGLKCAGASFRNAMIDNREFAEYVRKNGGIDIPKVAVAKDELSRKLDERAIDKKVIQKVLAASSLK